MWAEAVLTHPKYVKQAKGRKTDFRDAIHIANLFRMNLVVVSFIPPSDIRDLRELCRYRLKLTYMRTSEKNRYQNSMTISKVRQKCSGNTSGESYQKRTQSKPTTEASANSEPKTAKRKKAATSSTAKASDPSKQSVPVTATA